MPFTTVPYVELTDGNSEGADDDGGSATKCYLVAWASRFQFVRDVMGYSSVAGGVGSSWNRKYPMAYPDDPHLYARSVNVTPAGAFHTTTPLSWDDAIIAVNFKAPNWSFSTADDPLYLNSFTQDATENQALVNCTQSLDFGVEYVSIPGAKAVIDDGSPTGIPVGTSVDRRVTVVRMTLTWPDLPYMPLSGILTYSDVLNDALFLGRPKGTIMLEGCKTNRKRMADGTVVQDVSISLKTRKDDWNKVPAPDATFKTLCFGVDAFGNPDTTKTKFPYVDFSPLLFLGSSS